MSYRYTTSPIFPDTSPCKLHVLLFHNKVHLVPFIGTWVWSYPLKHGEPTEGDILQKIWSFLPQKLDPATNSSMMSGYWRSFTTFMSQFWLAWSCIGLIQGTKASESHNHVMFREHHFRAFLPTLCLASSPTDKLMWVFHLELSPQAFFVST